MLKMRVAELKIGRRLAGISAVHHQTEVFGLDVFSSGSETVVHSGLHGMLRVMSWLIHGLKKQVDKDGQVISTKNQALRRA